jgi:hypothetical protein
MNNVVKYLDYLSLIILLTKNFFFLNIDIIKILFSVNGNKNLIDE